MNDFSLPRFEGNSILAVMPLREYDTVWQVVIEAWDGTLNRVVWQTGMLATNRQQLFKRKTHLNLQDALDHFAKAVNQPRPATD